MKKHKKQRVKISSVNDFKNLFTNEGYEIDKSDDEEFNNIIKETFIIDDFIVEKLNSCLQDELISYKVDDCSDFIDYVKKMICFEKYEQLIINKIKNIQHLIIQRVEYERIESERQSVIEEDVRNLSDIIERTRNTISSGVTEEHVIDIIENEIDEGYVYAKDIEFLKKIIIEKNESLREEYDEENKVKTLYIDIPKHIEKVCINHEKGSVEYHQYLTANIPRIKRLIRNLDKYMETIDSEKGIFKINQSSTIHDSVNMAIAYFNNKEFKAVSGKNDLKGYCSAPFRENFEGLNVNKRGMFGVGYKRINDSEKKIFERIHEEIEENMLDKKGELFLYSKWEPCPSCYFVISQFCEKYPLIDVRVKYKKRYGE